MTSISSDEGDKVGKGAAFTGAGALTVGLWICSQWVSVTHEINLTTHRKVVGFASAELRQVIRDNRRVDGKERRGMKEIEINSRNKTFK